ncbi:11438_t:CDS:2, partial [Cetraspora pellucida]
SKDKFDAANLCFINNIETDIFDKFLFNETREEVNNLTENKSETEEFTDLVKDIISKHSYPISKNIQIIASQYHHLTQEIQDDIELLAASNVYTRAIINVLMYKYPDQYIYTHSVYNIIQTVKAEKEKLNNARATYKELMY